MYIVHALIRERAILNSYRLLYPTGGQKLPYTKISILPKSSMVQDADYLSGGQLEEGAGGPIPGLEHVCHLLPVEAVEQPSSVELEARALRVTLALKPG